MKDLLSGLVAKDPKNRPASIKEVLGHDFFEEHAASHGEMKAQPRGRPGEAARTRRGPAVKLG